MLVLLTILWLSYMVYDMSEAERRVNARIDASLARRLAAVARRTGKTPSQIIKESLARYCDSVLESSPMPAVALREFVGCASGPGNLSTTYKQQLASSLDRKR